MYEILLCGEYTLVTPIFRNENEVIEYFTSTSPEKVTLLPVIIVYLDSVLCTLCDS